MTTYIIKGSDKMSNNKFPYEISLWHEVAGKREEKLAVLGGSGLVNFEGAAVNGKFTANIKWLSYFNI